MSLAPTRAWKDSITQTPWHDVDELLALPSDRFPLWNLDSKLPHAVASTLLTRYYPPANNRIINDLSVQSFPCSNNMQNG